VPGWRTFAAKPDLGGWISAVAAIGATGMGEAFAACWLP
jgi:hypothetical protein